MASECQRLARSAPDVLLLSDRPSYASTTEEQWGGMLPEVLSATFSHTFPEAEVLLLCGKGTLRTCAIHLDLNSSISSSILIPCQPTPSCKFLEAGDLPYFSP